MITLHCALKPQIPGQGSIHFVFEHALFNGQSALIVHSGRHPVPSGVPKNPGKHSHRALSFDDLQTVFIPHGDGLHGSITVGSATGYTDVY